MVRDDVKMVVGKISLYISKSENSKHDYIKNVEKVLPEMVDTPGPLRAIGNILDNNTKLSKINIIKFTNTARNENESLPPLTENLKLDLSAEKKLQDMFDKQYFEHISPSGVGVSDLGNKVGYEYILLGENLALGNFKDDQALVDAWMASPGHRANILNSHYTEIGVAVGRGKFNGNDTWLAVQHFGTSRSICPSIDEVLHGVIDVNQSNIEKMSSDLAIRKSMIDKKAIYEGSTYSEQVAIYNNLVNTYNKLISDTKLKINNYNDQIKTFNLCLTKNQ